MTDTLPSAPLSGEPDALSRAAELLGGKRVLHHDVRSPLDAHDLLLAGLPGKALSHLVGSLTVIRKTPSLEKAIGMSLRTFQRRRDAPAKALNADQSARTWKFAGILAKATEILGSQEEAERWLERPALALDQRRPLDLLATPAGAELVETLLARMEYGVYS